MSMNMTMYLNNEYDFPELGSKSSKSSVTFKKEVDVDDVDDVDDVVVILDTKQQQPKKLFCKNIIEGKECPFDKKCLFAHSYEEKYNDICNFGDNCRHIYFSKSGYCLNSTPKFKICIRKHPSEDLSAFHKRIGTHKKFPNVPEKKCLPDRRFTKMCRSVNSSLEPCDRKTCTYAHDDHELIILPCRFKEKCYNVEYKDGLFKNKGEKICRFLHLNETKQNHKLRTNFS